MSLLRVLAVWVAFALLLIAGAWFSSDGREYTATSFGELPDGYRAVFELLKRSELPVERSFSDPAGLPSATLWMIEPPGFCSGLHEASDEDRVALGNWIRRGGTALIFLPSDGEDACGRLAGVDLPSRQPLVCEKDEKPETGGKAPTSIVTLTGPLLPKNRHVSARHLRRFHGSEDWTPRLEANGEPFAIELTAGEGRLVVVADAAILRNRTLDRRDNSLAVMDLVRAYGVPLIDEWSQGFRKHESLPLYLLGSPALPVFFGVALLGLLVAWHGSVVPARESPSRSTAPSLDSSVDNLAAAYAATADYGALVERYRHYAVSRLRQHLRLPAEADPSLLVEVLRRRRGLSSRDEALLMQAPEVKNRTELHNHARELDRIILHAMHAAHPGKPMRAPEAQA